MQEKQNKMRQMPMGKLVASMSLPLMISLWFNHFSLTNAFLHMNGV